MRKFSHARSFCSFRVVFVVPFDLEGSRWRYTSLANLFTPFSLGPVPDQIRPSVSQPLPASALNGPSAASSSANDARHAPASSEQQPPQPQALPRYPREVPPRFRHQEHKQLLKRGQHFPAIAANLGPAVKAPSSQCESSPFASLQPHSSTEVLDGRQQAGEPRRAGAGLGVGRQLSKCSILTHP